MDDSIYKPCGLTQQELADVIYDRCKYQLKSNGGLYSEDYLKQKSYTYAGYFLEAERKEGINALYLFALSINEKGMGYGQEFNESAPYGSVDYYKNIDVMGLNNAGGDRDPYPSETAEESIMAAARRINNYTRGGTEPGKDHQHAYDAIDGRNGTSNADDHLKVGSGYVSTSGSPTYDFVMKYNANGDEALYNQYMWGGEYNFSNAYSSTIDSAYATGAYSY